MFIRVCCPKEYTDKLKRKLTPINTAGSLRQIADMNESVGKSLGQRIRALREAAGLTQADVAQLTIKSVETISNFERGKTTPSVHTLATLAQHLGCSVADFFVGDVVTSRDVDPVAAKLSVLDDRDRRLVKGFIEMLIAEGRR